MVLFLSLIFCKQEEQLLFFASVSDCTCLILHGYSIFCFVHDAQDQVQDCVILIVIEVDMDNYTILQFIMDNYTILQFINNRFTETFLYMK